jgi:hypothetical protein
VIEWCKTYQLKDFVWCVKQVKLLFGDNHQKVCRYSNQDLSFNSVLTLPQNDLILKCCLIHLKNVSIPHHDFYNSATVEADSLKLFVRNIKFLCNSSSKNTTRLNDLEYRCEVFTPVRRMI